MATHTIKRDPKVIKEAETANNTAVALHQKGETMQALEMFIKSHKLFEQTLGNDPLTATAMFNVARIYGLLGEKEKAVDCYKKSLHIYRSSAGDNRVDIGDTLNNMATQYCEMEEYNKSLECYVEALAIREQVLGRAHFHVADSLLGKGVAHEKMKDYCEAITCYHQALTIRRKINEYNPDDADNLLQIASLLSNLGGVYNKTSRYDEALESYDEAYTIRSDILGTDHEKVAEALFSIGSTHLQKYEKEQCLDCWKAALQIQRTVLGNHKDTEKTLYFMALVYSTDSAHPVKAILCFEGALAVCRALGMDDEDPHVALITQNIQKLKQRLADTNVSLL